MYSRLKQVGHLDFHILPAIFVLWCYWFIWMLFCLFLVIMLFLIPDVNDAMRLRMSECLDLLLYFLRCLDEGDLACTYVVQNKLVFLSFCVWTHFAFQICVELKPKEVLWKKRAETKAYSDVRLFFIMLRCLKGLHFIVCPFSNMTTGVVSLWITRLKRMCGWLCHICLVWLLRQHHSTW